MTTNAQTHQSTCEYCMLSQICAHPLTKEECQYKQNPIVKHTEQLKRKELLYSYRDHFKCVYAVHTGAIKTFQVDMHGQERIHNFYLPGEIIGLEAIQTGFYPYSAMAITPSSVCEVPFDHLLNVVADTPNLQKQLFVSLSQRINLGQYVTAPTAEQRLAAFILDMAKRLNGNGSNIEIELPMSRYDIGNFLGLAPETISRLFTRFQQAELLRVQNKKITLLDAANLQWMAQDGVSTQKH